MHKCQRWQLFSAVCNFLDYRLQLQKENANFLQYLNLSDAKVSLFKYNDFIREINCAFVELKNSMSILKKKKKLRMNKNNHNQHDKRIFN